MNTLKNVLLCVLFSVSAGCMIAKRKLNGILYFRVCSFHSRLPWLKNPSWRLVIYHHSQFSMDTLFWSSRSLRTMRVRQKSTSDTVPGHLYPVPFHTQVGETQLLPRTMLLPLESCFHPPTTLSIHPGLACHPPTTLSILPGLVCNPPTTLSIHPGLACHPPTTLSIHPGLACHPPTTLSILPGLVNHLLLLPHQECPEALDPFNRQREWRLHKAALENQERVRKGEPPKKRQAKESYHYECKLCGQPKSKQTGHSQLRGKWYCPASGQTLEEWRSSL
ncbi:hypothetical protein N1851_024170 [Merluccius polli]|uniref:Uncharacterized protein n=1 Tax=Merluccius polli TaxID=89951 RepID=A0AA47MFM2_MERPO|nr:hypothetical protein N1851_024170 [Merluccius polli]